MNKQTMTGVALALSLFAAPALAQDIVLGGSIPMTGVFGFAGVGIHDGITDYVKIVNDKGGIGGRKIKYVYEDTAYKVDASVAAFNKMVSQDNPILYYGDSTAFSKTIAPELARKGTMLMAGASFASELNDAEKYPFQFMAGPDYTAMFGILLNYIAKEKPGAKLAFVYSDTEFGRDPITPSEAAAQKLGLKVVEKIVTPPGSVDVSTEVLKLRRADPDFTIFHGYVLAPIPEFVAQAKQMNLKTKFMGTFWTMDNGIVMKMGDAADGFMGVMPYRYLHEKADNAPMMDKIRQMRPDYMSNGAAYMQGFVTTMLMAEAARICTDQKKALDGKNLKGCLNQIKDFDTGGVIGVPVTVKGNSVPVGRVYKADGAKKQMLPVSDWIVLK